MDVKNIIFSASIGVSAIACTSDQPSNTDQKPNIIFIMTDDHATQALSCYDSYRNQTPNLDKLASQGVLFKNAFVTNSICAPSRAVILTGMHSHLNGVKNNHTPFDSSKVTFPKILHDNGYETAIVGKWHLKTQPTGFDYWNVLPGQGYYYNPEFIKLGTDTAYEGYVTDIITRLSLEWLSQRNSDKPFLLMMHHKAPHRNWMPATSFLDTLDKRKFPVPGTFFDQYKGREHLNQQQLTVTEHMDYQWDLKIPCDTCPIADVNRGAHKRYKRILNRLTDNQREAWDKGYQDDARYFNQHHITGKVLDFWKYQRYMEDYLRCIISVDNSVGRLMDYLESNNLDENTLVIYTSDQGFFLGEHRLFDKRYMYEESFRTPLIMKYPGNVPQGQKNDQLVQNLDIAPTILDFAGVSIPDFMQGESMRRLMKENEEKEWRDAVYYHFYEKGWGVASHYGIRTQRFKLIHFYDPVDHWELYDLKNDPNEVNNLYGNPEYKDTIKELKNKLDKLQSDYKVPNY